MDYCIVKIAILGIKENVGQKKESKLQMSLVTEKMHRCMIAQNKHLRDCMTIIDALSVCKL